MVVSTAIDKPWSQYYSACWQVLFMLCDYCKSIDLNAAAPPTLILMPPLFHSTSVRMKDETRDRRRDLLWALPASLILHALIIALLVYGLPRPPQQPQEEQAVNVTLVPPPDQPKPKPAPPPSSKGSQGRKAAGTESRKTASAGKATAQAGDESRS